MTSVAVLRYDATNLILADHHCVTSHSSTPVCSGPMMIIEKRYRTDGADTLKG